jgi:hypothetical protein
MSAMESVAEGAARPMPFPVRARGAGVLLGLEQSSTVT